MTQGQLGSMEVPKRRGTGAGSVQLIPLSAIRSKLKATRRIGEECCLRCVEAGEMKSNADASSVGRWTRWSLSTLGWGTSIFVLGSAAKVHFRLLHSSTSALHSSQITTLNSITNQCASSSPPPSTSFSPSTPQTKNGLGSAPGRLHDLHARRSRRRRRAQVRRLLALRD